MMMKLLITKLIISVFFVEILAQNEEFSPNNETVALLLPNLHLGALRAKALHDITAARLRQHLPIRRHHFLRQEIPEFLMSNVTVSNETNSNEISSLKDNKTLPLAQIEQTDSTKGFQNQQNDEDYWTRLLDYVVKRELESSKSLNQSRRDAGDSEVRKRLDDLIDEIEKVMSTYTIPRELYEPAPNFKGYLQQMLAPLLLGGIQRISSDDQNNTTEIDVDHTNKCSCGKLDTSSNFDKKCLCRIPSEEEAFEENLRKQLETNNKKSRKVTKETLEENLSIELHLPENEKADLKTRNNRSPNFEENQNDEIPQTKKFKKYKKHKKHHKAFMRENDEKLFLDSLNHFSYNDQDILRSINYERPTEGDLSRDGKGFHTHHFSLSHGVKHHPPSFAHHVPLKPHPFPVINNYPPFFKDHHRKNLPLNSFPPSFHDKKMPFPQLHEHQNHIAPQLTINKQQNFLPPHGHFSINQHNTHRSSNDNQLKQFYIIQAPENHQIFKRSVPILKLMADPNVKLDMPKTVENIGTVAKNSFEDDKAPMYHIRNMVGSAKNVILAALRIPPQDAIIPTQYKIIDRSDLKKDRSPDIASRFAGDPDEDNFIQTFKRVGLMLRESVKSGQETLQHMTDVAHSARKAIVTTGYATPKLLTPYVKAAAIKKDKNPEKLMLITPRIGEVTDRESLPDPTDEYVKIGDLMDALGVSNPEKNKVGLTRIVMHPKKPNKIQSRFGNEQTKKDFFIVAEHIDDDKNRIGDSSKGLKGIKDVISGKSLKNILGDIREEILKKSRGKDEKTFGSKSEKIKEFFEDLFPLKSGDESNDVSEVFDRDVEEILKFDWEKIEASPTEGTVNKEVATNKLKTNQDIDYNEVYQKVVNDQIEDMKK